MSLASSTLDAYPNTVYSGAAVEIYYKSRLLVFGIDDQRGIDVRWGDKQYSICHAMKPQNRALAYEHQAVNCMSVGT